MGPYCDYCGRRCFVQRVLRDGRDMLLATCQPGAEHDRGKVGEDHATAVNPTTDPDAADRLRAAAGIEVQRYDVGGGYVVERHAPGSGGEPQ